MKPTTTETRNVLLLAGAQALFQTATVMLLTLSGLAGLMLAPQKSLSTLPLAMMAATAAVTMIPASMFMQRWGRRAGFLLGASLGSAAGLIAAAGIELHSFWLFVLANMLVGGYQSFAQFYRFAAADVASADFRSRAISWVVAGGVFAAVAGPNLARFTQRMGALPYTVSYLALSGLGLVALLLIARLALPPVVATEVRGAARPLAQIMRQPIFLTALVCSSVGFAVMIMVMTATPLAMQMCGQPLDASATVIQWHVLGMFLPSFFTGKLIRRFGVFSIVCSGIAFLLGGVAVALSGIEFPHFLGGLILLGVGWNFMFIGGTTLLTDAYRSAERAKTQAAHDFLMFGAVSLASFSAGSLLNAWGWRGVNLTALPFLALAALMVVLTSVPRRTQVPGSAQR